MNDRIARLRRESFETEPSISIERALLETAFYRENYGKHSLPVLRAMVFKDLCEKKTLWLGDGELIVGERGPRPKCVPTFPELTCHSAEDLRVLNSRPMTRYHVSEEDIAAYEREVIPYWTGRSMRDRVFSQVPAEWRAAYEAGLFTEFMEQRAPGHTALDGTIYSTGMLDFKARIADRLARLVAEGLRHRMVGVTETAHRDASDGIEVPASLLVPQPDAFPPIEGDRLAGVRPHQGI